MMQIQLINNVIVWERRLEIEAEQRMNRRSEPEMNYPAVFRSSRKEDVTAMAARVELVEKERENHLCPATITCQPAA